MEKIIIFKTEIRDGVWHIVVRIFGVLLWASLYSKDGGWFRILGIGIKWKHESVGLTFSERNGYRKYLKIGKWIFGYLSKFKMK